MSASLTVIEPSENLPAALGPELASAVELAQAEKAASTRKAYGTDFRLFRAWCDAKGVSSLPAAAETVAAYLAAEAEMARPSTLGRRVAAIRYAQIGRASASDRFRGRQGDDARYPPDLWQRQGTQGASGSGKDAGHGCHG